MARRMNTNAFDAQVSRLLSAALRDLYVAGVDLPEQAEPLAVEAAITYFLVHFGSPDEYDRLKTSYDEQKAQLRTLSGFTDWGFDTANSTSTSTTFDILSDGLTVTTAGADILAAYLRGDDLRLVVGNAVMLATGYDYTDGVLSVDFRDGTTLYKVVVDGDGVTLRRWAIYATEEDESEENLVYFVILGALSADGERYAVTNSPADILAAYAAGKLIVVRLIEAASTTDWYPFRAVTTDTGLLTVNVWRAAEDGYSQLAVDANNATFYLNPFG